MTPREPKARLAELLQNIRTGSYLGDGAVSSADVSDSLRELKKIARTAPDALSEVEKLRIVTLEAEVEIFRGRLHEAVRLLTPVWKENLALLDLDRRKRRADGNFTLEPTANSSL